MGDKRSHVSDIVLIAIYVVVATVMPLYNYYSMSYQYGYPINSTALQLLFTSVVCCVVAGGLQIRGQKRDNKTGEKELLVEKEPGRSSYLYTRETLQKLRVLLLPAFLFSLDISLNNTSLFLTSVSINCILKTVGIVLGVLLAFIIQRDHINRYEWCCVIVLMVGSAMTTGDIITQATEDRISTVMGVMMSFSSTALGNTYSILVKRAQQTLDKRGIVPHPIEVGAIVFGLMALFMFVYSAILETGCWPALAEATVETWLTLLLGCVLTLTMKLTQTWLLIRQKLMSYSVASDSKIVPQLLLDALFFHKYDMNAVMVIGAVLCVGGVIGYGVIRTLKSKKG